MLGAAGIVEELQTDALVAIDKLDKIGLEGVKKELSERGVSSVSADGILGFIADVASKDANADILAAAESFVGGESAAIAQMREILALTGGTKIKIDPSLARGLSYYTGAIFEIAVPDLAGSLGGGGRYDGLIGMFGKDQIPACGFSLGLERIIVVMDERGMFPTDFGNSSADVMVTVWSEESVNESVNLAKTLRESGLRVLVYPEADKLGKQFKYASQINISKVCILGESEIADGTVTIKDMDSGDQVTVKRNQAVDSLRK
jgi:histidyl-tRNA synthetase